MTHLGIIKELGLHFSPLNDGDLRDGTWGETESGKWRVNMNDKRHPSQIAMFCNYCCGQEIYF